MTTAKRRRVLAILGMHRCGTSVVSRTINLLGAEISSNLISPHSDNPLGFWEPLELVKLNDRFLSAAGSSWDDPRPLRAGWMDPAIRQNEIEQAVGFLAEEFPKAPLFSIKDSRLSRLLPIWLAAFTRLEIEPFFIIACRNPLAVCASLQARNNLSIGSGQLIWLRHMLEAETATRGNWRIIVHYEDFLRDWRDALAPALGRLALLGAAPSGCETEIDKFLDTNAQHHIGSIEALLANNEFSDLTKEAYIAFKTVTDLDAISWRHKFDEFGRRLDRIFDIKDPAKGPGLANKPPLEKTWKGDETRPNRLLSLPGKMFRLAKVWGFMEPTADDPVVGIERYKEHKRKRWLTPEELLGLAKAIDKEGNIYIRAALWLYMLTGARKSELLEAKWDDVDWARGQLRLPGTKAGEEQAMSLSKPALAILLALPRQGRNPYILPGAKKGRHLVKIDKPWRQICKAAGVKGVRLHDLRRTVASWLSQGELDLNRIKDALHHANIETTLIYARLGEDAAKAAMEEHGRRMLEDAGKHRPTEVVGLDRTK